MSRRCAPRFDRRGDDRLDVAQTEVQPLRPDRREGVRRVADQREPGGAYARHDLAHHREHAGTPFEPHRAEDRAGLALDLERQRRVVERLRAGRASPSDITQTRLERSGAASPGGSGTRVNGPWRV